MDAFGELSMHFEANVLEFFKPKSERANVRMCIGFREKINEVTGEDAKTKYQNSNQYDVIQLSMRNFTVPAQ